MSDQTEHVAVKQEPPSPPRRSLDETVSSNLTGKDEMPTVSTSGHVTENAKVPSDYDMWVPRNGPEALIRTSTEIPKSYNEFLPNNNDGNTMYNLYQQTVSTRDVIDRDGEDFGHAAPGPVKSERSNLPKKYKCAMCAYRTRYKSDLNRHVRKHAIATFNCDICNMPFKTAGNVEFHKRKEHPAVLGDSSDTPKFKCKFCSYGTMYSSDLTRHVRKHGVARFHCGECNRPFMTSGSLVNHKRAIHNSNDYEVVMGFDGIERVVVRNEEFETGPYNPDDVNIRGMDLSMHGNRRSQGSEDIHKWEENSTVKCSDETGIQNGLQEIKDLSPEGMDLCNEADLSAHSKTDTPEKTNNTAVTEESPEGTCSLPKDESVVAVNEDATTSSLVTETRQNESLEVQNGDGRLNDEADVTGQGKYKCEQCTYSTNYKTTYERHIKRHGFACHSCEICNMPFITLGHMLKHQKDCHSNRTPKSAVSKNKCPACDFQTTDLNELRLHCDTNHHLYQRGHLQVPVANDGPASRAGMQQSGSDKVNAHIDPSNEMYSNTSRLLSPWPQRAIKSEVEDGVSYQPPMGRYAKLVSDFDDFACRPFACSLCFYRTGDVQSLARHAENHLTGCCVEGVPQTARFSASPFLQKLLPNNNNFVPNFQVNAQDIPQYMFNPAESTRYQPMSDQGISSNTALELTRETNNPVMNRLNFQGSRKASCNSQASILEGMLQGLGYYRGGTSNDQRQIVNPTFSVHYRKDQKNKLKPYLCLMCKKRFRHLTLMKQHFKIAHSDVSSKIYPCKVCTKIFHDPMSFQEHYEVNHFS